ATRTLSNETRGKIYEAAALSPQEEEIRRSGGIIKVGRREFAASVRRAPNIEWPDPATARRLTSTEQILWAHRVDKDAEIRPGADSHSRAYGAYGALGYGVGSTTLGFGWATGYVHFTVAKQRRVAFTGKLQPWVSGKDVVLALLQRWGAKQSGGMSVEFVDRDRQLPMAYRNTIANMMAEGEALNGIFAPDDITYAHFAEKGMHDLPYPRFGPGPDATYEADETLDLSQVVPLIAKPFSPANAVP